MLAARRKSSTAALIAGCIGETRFRASTFQAGASLRSTSVSSLLKRERLLSLNSSDADADARITRVGSGVAALPVGQRFFAQLRVDLVERLAKTLHLRCVLIVAAFVRQRFHVGR